jgi:hypothetical protein
MVLGMSLSTFTEVHVVISLIGISSGIIVLAGMLGTHRFAGWTVLFLATTVLTSLTGFFFPFTHVTPAHVVGVISLVVLAVAILALYVYHLAGPWRWLYVAGATLALYLNVFVGVVQAFQKLPFLTRLAPTQSEPPFLVAQLAVLVIFGTLGILAARRFRPATRVPA